jgi:cobalt/nickel transport system permease protein
MHIPDGYLSPQTCAVLYGAAAPFWYVALRRVKRVLNTRFLPLISIFAAFSFVVMMFNLPLPGGTTGHAIGVGVAAVVLGPWASILAISTALVIQALFFGDGGITAIGANCFNMAIVGSLSAYVVYRIVAARAGLGSQRRVFAGAVAGYVAINLSALCAAIEFGLQPALFRDAAGTPLYCPYPLSISVPAMMIGHLTFAGLAELIITAGVIAHLQRTDPYLLKGTAPDAPDCASEAPVVTPRPAWVTLRRFWLVVGLLLVLTPLGIVAVGSAWGEWGPEEFTNAEARQRIEAASRDHVLPARPPQGLERLATVWKAPISRYAPGFVRSAHFGYMLSALIGVGLIALLFWSARLITPKLQNAGGRKRRRRGFVEQTVHGLFHATEYSLFAEEIARRPGLLQSLEPRVKLVALLSFVVAASVTRSIVTLGALLTLAIGAALFSRIPLIRVLLKIWLPVLAFSGAIALPAIFLTKGSILYRIPVLDWAITEQGVRTALLLLLRVETVTTLAALVVFTTEWARILRALRFFRVPATAVAILSMTYRYVFLFLKTAREMFESRQSRLVGALAPRERRRLAAGSVGVLLARSFELSSEVHSAMCSRGFRGEIHLLEETPARTRDWVQLVLVIALAAIVIAVGR